MTKKDVWNGESRGCGDVIFERLCIRERKSPSRPRDIWVPFAIQALVQHSEKTGKNLAAILEEEWVRGSE